jgi:hypothetical protein
MATVPGSTLSKQQCRHLPGINGYWDCPGNEVSCSCFDEQVIACGGEIY